MKKSVALLLAVMLLWSCMAPSVTALAESVSDSADELHFIIRHWHTKDDSSGSMFQDGSLPQSGDRYFVVVEGYIIPPRLSDTNQYEFELLDSDGQRVRVHNTEGVDGSISKSNYVSYLDHGDGTITLSTNTLYKDDQTEAENQTEAEKFSSYSVSAGHSAVTTDNEKGILTIQYDPHVHLVKAHAFYVSATVDTEDGVKDETVLGDTGITAGQEDTAEVYKNAAGYVKYGDKVLTKADVAEAQKVLDGTAGDDPKYNRKEAQDILDLISTTGVVQTKIYDSTLGLHTDKSVSVNTAYDDGRTFDLDLESWFSIGYSPQVAMILDASGSMGFAMDKPTAIKVDQNTALYDLLEYKIGSNANGFKIEDDFMKNLVGYYEIVSNGANVPNGNGAQYRAWYLNSSKVQTSPTTAEQYAELRKDPNYQDYFAKFILQQAINHFDFSEDNQLTLVSSYEDSEGRYLTFGNHVPVNFSGSTGLNLTYIGKDRDGVHENSAFLLESASDLPVGIGIPFTLSFSLKQNGSTTRTDDVEVLYIGPAVSPSGFSDLNGYFHVIRRGNDLIASFISSEGSEESVTLPITVWQDAYPVITFAYDGEQMTAYIDNKLQASVNVPGLSHEAIVFAPFEDDADTADDAAYFYVDSISLFKAALNGGQVDALYALQNGKGLGYSASITEMLAIDGVDAFLTSDELALLMDPHNTDNSALGWAGYSYFVQDASGDYNALAYYNNDANGAVISRVNRPATSGSGEGWYYVNSTATQSVIDPVGTAKQLHGLATGNFTYKGENYNNSANGPMKFFIDSDGYLCCFYSSGDTSRLSSYVYFLKDSEYVRTEALQRALGLFATQLAEWAPNARMSAVRFSTDNGLFKDRQKLLLLNWTERPDVSTGMLNLEYGDGGFYGKTDGQYNYVLTGGTSTYDGLQAFIENLKNDVNPYKDVPDSEVPRYIIIFTDGKDDNVDDSGNGGNAAITLANSLKDEGYIIFTVLLDGGAMGNYDAAKTFLTKLAGKKVYDPGEKASDYFFSVKKAREADDADEYKSMTDTDILTKLFVDDILTQIAHPLSGYTVQDYIDPRFDLVDKYGVIWHLNAGGSVEKHTADGLMPLDLVDTEATDDEGNVVGAIFELSDYSDAIAQTPSLCYDREKDLYYLKWTDQVIPGSAVGATSLPVWNARVTIRAKDDFIGGNAVLTNGTDEKMNYVYSQALTENERDSGTKNAKPSDTTDVNPALSKGFPRVSVNITPPRKNVQLSQTIYMSESLNKDDIAKDLIEAAYDKSEGLERLYWEYIGRFVDYFNWLKDHDPDEVIKKLHEMNRLGDERDHDAPDSLVPGEIKIISNRLYDLIWGTNEYGSNPEKKTLSVDVLSELLIKEDTVIDEEGKVKTEQYLYLPYIYLPDNPENPTNSTGNGRHLWDVVGYLYFHVEDTDGVNYPSYPEADGGATKDTRTRMSRLTVSFEVRNPDVRGTWNNNQMIVDDDYKRDTAAKPAEGTATDEKAPIVIKGEFTSYIVSGEIALQVVISDTAAARLRELHQTVTYTADLYWNDNLVGMFTAVIDPDKLSATGNVVNATIIYNDFGGYQMNQYGLPKGVYTLKNGQGTNVPEGFVFGDLELISNSDDYESRLFPRGTDNDKPQEYLATISDDDSFILGDEKGADRSKRYTDYRFGLVQVTLTYTGIQTGDLMVRKHVTGNAGDPQAEFTFMIMLSDTSLNGAYGDIVFTNGIAIFTLKHGESKTAAGLPAGIHYSVSEQSANQDGYATAATGENGIIAANTTATALFVNTKDVADVPQTDDKSEPELWVALMIATLLGMATFTLASRKGIRKKVR